MDTLTSQIVAYINTNPGACSREISEALGTSIQYVGAVARRIEQRGGPIVSEVTLQNGTYKRIYFPETVRENAQTIIKRAAQIGHPFGIAAAQIMRGNNVNTQA